MLALPVDAQFGEFIRGQGYGFGLANLGAPVDALGHHQRDATFGPPAHVRHEGYRTADMLRPATGAAGGFALPGDTPELGLDFGVPFLQIALRFLRRLLRHVRPFPSGAGIAPVACAPRSTSR